MYKLSDIFKLKCIFFIHYSTNITNEKLIANDINRNWKNTPQAVHDDYGESYVEKYQVIS